MIYIPLLYLSRRNNGYYKLNLVFTRFIHTRGLKVWILRSYASLLEKLAFSRPTPYLTSLIALYVAHILN